jgi:hypothetical protein
MFVTCFAVGLGAFFDPNNCISCSSRVLEEALATHKEALRTHAAAIRGELLQKCSRHGEEQRLNAAV